MLNGPASLFSQLRLLRCPRWCDRWGWRGWFGRGWQGPRGQGNLRIDVDRLVVREGLHILVIQRAGIDVDLRSDRPTGLVTNDHLVGSLPQCVLHDVRHIPGE